ncbi:siderophore iron transporter [Hyaloscypha variabilis]
MVSNVGKDSEDISTAYWHSYQFVGSLIAIVLVGHSLFLGYVLPVNVLSIINEEIGPSDNVTLISLVFTLVSGVGLLLVGRISDIVGRRYFIIGGQAFGLIGSIVCAKAKSINMVIGGTVFVGLSGAVANLYPLLVQELMPNKYRGYGQAAVTLAMVPTLGFGPLIARSLVTYTALSWRWCYWLNVIVTGLAIILLATCYFPPNFHQLNTNMTKMQEFKQLDYGGFVLYCAGLILILLGFSWPSNQYTWGNPHVISTLVVGCACLISFVVYEIYMPLKQPLLLMHLFKIRTFVVVVVVGSVGQMVYFALNVLWPQQITALYTTDNMKIGAISCTTGAALALGEIITGPFFKAVGHARWQIVASAVGVTAFCGMMAATNANTQAMAIAGTIIAGIFVGWIEMVCIVTATLVVPPEDIGSSSAFFASVRAVTGTIAVSIYVAIFSNELTADLPKEIVPAVVGAGLPVGSVPLLFEAVSNGTSTALNAVPGINPGIIAALKIATKTAYSSSFKIVYLSSLGFGGFAVAASFFAKNVDQFMTDFVNKTVVNKSHYVKEKTGDAELV